MKDSYQILGVNPNSSDEEIKTVYKRLAKKYHPDNFATAPEDKKKQAEEKMKAINAAYDSIKEDRSRPKPPPIEDFPFPPDFIDIILGRNRQRQTTNNPTRGTDLRYDLTIELEEAAFGKETKIKVPRQETCSHCQGKGGADLETCPDCHGTGQSSIIMKTLLGQFQTVKTCQRCHGKGKIIKTPCKHCHGNGKVNVTREISLNIPKALTMAIGLEFAAAAMLVIMAANMVIYMFTSTLSLIESSSAKATIFIVKSQSHLFRQHLEQQSKSQHLTAILN